MTELETGPYQNAAVIARVNASRTEIADGRDAWSVRFRSITADSERLVLEKERGVLHRAERSAVVETPEVQRFLADTGITFHFARAEEWSEIAIYPPASTRATRQQRERVEKALQTWSRDSSRYFRTVAHLYSFLEAHPHRAEVLFAQLFDGEQNVTEEEAALVGMISESMERLVAHMETAQAESYTIDEEFDLVYNPFPAEIVVRAPSSIESMEGFEKRDERTAAIGRRGIFDAITALEGKWVSPDPLAMLVRADREGTDLPDSSVIAGLPRHASSSVTPAAIEEELVRYLTPAQTYRVRWD